MATSTRIVDIKGGLNLVTPPLKRRGTNMQVVQNFRNDQDGGITRVGGYERFDGQQGPSEAIYWNIPFDNGSVAPQVGQTIVGGTTGTTAVVLSFVVNSGMWSNCDAAGVIYAVSVNGTFLDNETIEATSEGGFSTGFSDGFELGISDNICSSSLFAFGTTSSPFVKIYNTSTWAQVSNPASLPPNDVYSVDFHPAYTIMVCGHADSEYLTIYNTSTWGKLTNPSSIPTSDVAAVKFNSDGTQLAVLSTNGIIVYSSADSDPSNWTVVSTGISTVPSYTATDAPEIAFGKNDTLLAVPDANSPYVHIWNTSTWSKVSNPSTLPTGGGKGVAFCPDGSLLAVGHATSPYITIYNTSDWSKVSNPSTLPDDTVSALSFNKAGTDLQVAYNDLVTFYDVSDWSVINTTSGSFSVEIPKFITYSKSDEFRGFTAASTNYVGVWDGDNTNNLSPLAHLFETEIVFGCAFD